MKAWKHKYEIGIFYYDDTSVKVPMLATPSFYLIVTLFYPL